VMSGGSGDYVEPKQRKETDEISDFNNIEE
jgi:hypothetical protein